MTLWRMWVQVLYDSLMGDPYIAPRVPPRLLDLLEYHRTLIFYDDEDEEYFYDNAEQQVQSQLSGLRHVSAHMTFCLLLQHWCPICQLSDSKPKMLQADLDSLSQAVFDTCNSEGV